jgi:hypothetical protein
MRDEGILYCLMKIIASHLTAVPEELHGNNDKDKERRDAGHWFAVRRVGCRHIAEGAPMVHRQKWGWMRPMQVTWFLKHGTYISDT